MFQFECENGSFTLNAAPTRRPLLQLPPQMRKTQTPLLHAPDADFLSFFLWGRSPNPPMRLCRNRALISRARAEVPSRARERFAHVKRSTNDETVAATAAPDEEV